MDSQSRKGLVIMSNTSANRQYKDSLFVSYLTEDPKRLVEVYNAVFNSDVPEDTKIEINTLENVLYNGVNNDLSFTMGDNLVVLIEDQSTLNVNMPMRLLMYVARLYEKLLPTRAVYSHTQLKIPRPEFIVFYNGKDDMPDTMNLCLSDAFKEVKTKETLELTLTVYNINPGHNEEMRKKSRTLKDYSTFVAKVHENEKNGLVLDKAIRESIKYCIENDIMSKYIREHTSEVRNMLFVEYNPKEAQEVAFEEGRNEGIATGIAKGITRGLTKGRKEGRSEGLAKGRVREKTAAAKRMKADGVDIALICKYTGLPKRDVEM
jgi:predicted transposase/invertase (TIGR01784 family)